MDRHLGDVLQHGLHLEERPARGHRDDVAAGAHRERYSLVWQRDGAVLILAMRLQGEQALSKQTRETMWMAPIGHAPTGWHPPAPTEL